MPQPGWRDVAFSLKTFGAAVLALYTAFALDLAQPSWAMLTVFVVSQPIAGMVLAKSLFRVVGTIVGATVALALVAAFAQAPLLFLAALALWIGTCTFTAVLLRDAPAAYGAVLSGYTAAIVGIPAALAPETAFDYASGRCIEILLGIGCATLISQLVFPRTAGETLKTSVDATLASAADWTRDVLLGIREQDKALADQRTLIANAVTLDATRIYAAFDTPSVRAAGDVVRHLQGELLSLLAILVSINDRLELLRSRAPGKLEAVQDLLRRTSDLFDSGSPLRASDLDPVAQAIREETRDRLPGFDDMVSDYQTIPVRNVLLRIGDLLTTWRRLLALRDALFSDAPIRLTEAAPSTARYREVSFALIAGAVSCAAILASSAFWIATAWPNGSSAVIFSGVICSILAGQDDPSASAGNFLQMTILSAIAAAIYLFAILPLIDGFVSLVFALLPFYLPFGILLGMPRIGLKVTPLGLNLVAFLGLTNARNQTDFADFANSSLALLIGIAFGILMFRLLRPLGVEWTVKRIKQGILGDLERISARGGDVSRSRFASRMFDRINALLSRLDPTVPEQRMLMRSALSALRIGLNILFLKSVLQDLPEQTRTAIARVLAGLERYFGALRTGSGDTGTLPEIEDAVAQLTACPSESNEDLLTSLVALKSALHRHADMFGGAGAHPVPEVLLRERQA